MRQTAKKHGQFPEIFRNGEMQVYHNQAGEIFVESLENQIGLRIGYHFHGLVATALDGYLIPAAQGILPAFEVIPRVIPPVYTLKEPLGESYTTTFLYKNESLSVNRNELGEIIVRSFPTRSGFRIKKHLDGFVVTAVDGMLTPTCVGAGLAAFKVSFL